MCLKKAKVGKDFASAQTKIPPEIFTATIADLKAAFGQEKHFRAQLECETAKNFTGHSLKMVCLEKKERKEIMVVGSLRKHLALCFCRDGSQPRLM